ncbi:MAG: TIGR00341 family protein [Bacteroidales bacterium]|nr:TIGR00341 family protein [Bacteroidales bacterium]
MGKLIDTIKSITKLQGQMDVATAAENIKNNIYFRGPNVYILFFAIVIASLGLNVNSIPVIIGAMLVSPLMGPIVGFGMALGTNDRDLLQASLKHLVVMVSISIIASTLYFLLTPLRMENPTELLARTNPTIYDVLIALFGGLAGIFETSRKEKGTVIAGVAIATALMPPLCTIGFGISQMNLNYALGALYLFFINSVFIALATFVGVKYLRFPVKTYRDPVQQRKIHRLIFFFLLIIIIPSILSAISIIRQNNFERNVETFVSNVQRQEVIYIYDYRIDHSTSPSHVELVVGGSSADSNYRETIYALADEQGLLRSQVIIKNASFGHTQTHNNDNLLTTLISQRDRQQHLSDSLMSTLRQELDIYRAEQLPYEQLAAEIRSQYPSVSNVTLSHGAVSMPKDGKTDNIQPIVVVIIESDEALDSVSKTRLQKWIGIRLEGRPVKVIFE